MRPPSLSYRCRLCGAASYRKMVHRGPEGAMVYSGLYRCSGCSVTFSDPATWREAPANQMATVEVTEPDSNLIAQATPSPAQVARCSTWGMLPPSMNETHQFGDSEQDVREIQEAAARADRSKGRRR